MAEPQYEYRCTRNVIYDHLPEPDRSNLKTRNGHYVWARSRSEAMGEMKRRFPHDVDLAIIHGCKPFTCQKWRDQK